MINKAVKPDGFKYCKYVLIHINEIIEISHKPHDTIEDVAKVFDLKKYTDTKQTYYCPNRYLGSITGKFYLTGGSGTEFLFGGKSC